MGFFFILHPSSFILAFGEVQEWLNWQHWKCCERETVPWVRIPPSPPDISDFGFVIFDLLTLAKYESKAGRHEGE